MNEHDGDIYWKGYRDALRDILQSARESQRFNDDEELKNLIRELWADRVDKEEI